MGDIRRYPDMLVILCNAIQREKYWEAARQNKWSGFAVPGRLPRDLFERWGNPGSVKDWSWKGSISLLSGKWKTSNMPDIKSGTAHSGPFSYHANDKIRSQPVCSWAFLNMPGHRKMVLKEDHRLQMRW